MKVEPDVIKVQCKVKLLSGDDKLLEVGAFVKIIDRYHWPRHAKDYIGTAGLELIYCQHGMGFVQTEHVVKGNR